MKRYVFALVASCSVLLPSIPTLSQAHHDAGVMVFADTLVTERPPELVSATRISASYALSGDMIENGGCSSRTRAHLPEAPTSPQQLPLTQDRGLLVAVRLRQQRCDPSSSAARSASLQGEHGMAPSGIADDAHQEAIGRLRVTDTVPDDTSKPLVCSSTAYRRSDEATSLWEFFTFIAAFAFATGPEVAYIYRCFGFDHRTR
jgi:hypothetical protein